MDEGKDEKRKEKEKKTEKKSKYKVAEPSQRKHVSLSFFFPFFFLFCTNLSAECVCACPFGSKLVEPFRPRLPRKLFCTHTQNSVSYQLGPCLSFLRLFFPPPPSNPM